MREAVYLAMMGVASSVEAALEMDGVMRSAAIIIAKEIEEARWIDMKNALTASIRIG